MSKIEVQANPKEGVFEPDHEIELKENESIIEYPELGIKLIASLNTDKETLLSNVETNIKREGLGKIWPHQPQPDSETLSIVAGGPSLIDTIDELKMCIDNGSKVVGLANTTHVLLENGISPSAQVILDAKPRNADFLHEIDGCTYFIASQCDPSVFEKVLSFKNPRVYIWHAINNPEELQAVMDLGEPWAPVQAGSTITMRAVRMFQILGFWRFHMFGFDSCYMGDRHHAYDQPSADHFSHATIACNGREFEVSGWMVQQAMEFIDFCKQFSEGMEMVVHGDGLIAHMIQSVAQQEAA